MFAEPPALTWDGENRLIRVGPTAGTGVPEGAKKAEYAYDYLGRRVQKRVWTYTGGSWSGPVERRYVWSGWLLLMELEDCGTGFQPVRKYTWGLDLAGQNGAGASERAAQASAFLEAAGGIGGLLAVSDPNDPNDPNDPFGDFVYFYDGNGNVGQVVDLAHDPCDPAGAIVAKCEYDPYGQRIDHDPNVPEYDQPWRFSTHQFDPETGLLYAKRRYYSPGLGRWVNHDPIEEVGGANLYGYVQNRPVDRVDPYGLWEDGRGVIQQKIDRIAQRMQRLSRWYGRVGREYETGIYDRLQAEIDALQEEMERTPLGHSDFPGYPEFDWTTEDHTPGTRPVQDWPSGTWSHFRDLKDVEKDICLAICRCDKRAFESLGHQGQDYFSHYRAGYRWPLGHWTKGVDDSNLHWGAWLGASDWTEAQLGAWNRKCYKDRYGNWRVKPRDYWGTPRTPR